MARKVYTVEIDNIKLEDSVASKQSKVSARASEKEVENFGIVEINNKSAKARVKNTKDAGFQKTVVAAEKKSVKQNLAQIDDYFDFSFRKEETVVSKSAATKKVCGAKAKSVKAKEIIDSVRECEVYSLNDEARRIVSVAREGSLFG